MSIHVKSKFSEGAKVHKKTESAIADPAKPKRIEL